MNKTMRKCVVCGKKFTPKSANAITCSEKCYKARKAAKDKARKNVKKDTVKTEVKPIVEKEAKKSCPKAIKGKATEKIKLPSGCDTVVSVEGKNDFKVVALAFAIAISALGRIIRSNKIKSL